MKTGIDNKKGLVIVAVLWTIVVLMILVAVLGRKSRLDMKVSMARIEAVRCKWACRAGAEKAVAVLNEDETDNDSLLDLWSDSDEDFNDIPLENCLFSVRVIDEASKLNINYVTKDQLMGLPYMLEEIADAIIDWRDTNDNPGGLGVESGYYESLEFGYVARDGPFRTIRELLMVKDVTPELFYGEDTNFNGVLDYNERDGDATPPVDDGDAELDLGWIAHLTCYTPAEGAGQSSQNQSSQNQDNQNQSDDDQENQDEDTQNQNNQNSSAQEYAKVNINTASEIVLTALLGGGEDAESAALDIIAYRETAENGIEAISELTSEGILSNNVFSQIENYITTSSDIFTIYCIATADRSGRPGARLQTEVVVNRSSRPYEVLFSYQGTNN